MNTTSALAGITGEGPEIADHVLLRRIGQGAYGEVWLARNMTGAFRAVKVIHRQTFSDERPFQREFEGICRFEPVSRSHPGLVTILHVGQNPQAGNFYYVMEVADDTRTGQIIDVNSYVPRTLKEELANHRRLPLHKKLEIALSLASALEYLHAANLIHRDIKPANIIFVNGLAKFADVGLTVEVGGDMVGLGTKYFMPPEGPGAPTGDIFSLGKVLYELFMGLPAKDFPELPGAAEEFSATPALLRLNNIILKACHTDPKQRFQTAGELHGALLSVTEMVHDSRSGGTPSNTPGTSGLRKADLVASRSKTPRAGGQMGELAHSPVDDPEPPARARWTRKTALFVLLIAIPGVVFLSMHQNRPVAAPVWAPVIVLMDTTASMGIYDPDNINTGRSNADEVYTRLSGLDGIVLQSNMYREGIGAGWARESFVAGLRPDIVIIHRSSFFHPFAAQLKLPYPPFESPEQQTQWQAIYDSQDARLCSFIRSVGAVVPHTQFLIYSRGTDTNWLDGAYRENWTKALETELPSLQGRINTMVIPPQANGQKGTFRDPATMEQLRELVREINKKLEHHKGVKSK